MRGWCYYRLLSVTIGYLDWNELVETLVEVLGGEGEERALLWAGEGGEGEEQR